MLRVLTVNILFELADWERRRTLLADGLRAERADLIAIQEVNLKARTDEWLAEQLGMPYVYLVPYEKSGIDSIPLYGAAILSRYPFIARDKLDLQGQGRFAQTVQVDVEGRVIAFCNGHYYWQPGASSERTQQIQRLLAWLGELPPEMPVVAAGDFNGTPEQEAIALMRSRFRSAYATCHGREPAYTCPTPLKKPGSWWKTWGKFWLNWKNNGTLKPWRGTLDYIFVSPHWRVQDCQLILSEPDPRDRTLYASDHFGLVAELSLSAE